MGYDVARLAFRRGPGDLARPRGSETLLQSLPMMRILLLLLMLTTSWMLGPCPDGAAAEPVDYAGDILPILETYCIGCHTADDPAGGLSMQSHDDLLRGGSSGVAVTAGSPESSRLLSMISGTMEPVMPPDGEPGPNEEELAVLTAWIDQGAIGPEGDMPIKRALRVPEIMPAANVQIPVTAVAVSTDGKLQAVARFESLQVRSARDQSVLTRIEPQPGKINAVHFSDDSTRLLVASGLTGVYGRAAIYSVTSGELIRELVGHHDTLYAAVFSPDESIIATAGYDREIILWDVASGQPLRTLVGHNGAIFDLAFSPDGQVLASACADETVKIWHVASGQRLDTLSQPEAEVFAVVFTPDGQHITAGGADNRLRVWQWESKATARINPLVATRFVDESPLLKLAITPDGKSLVVLSESGNVKVLSTESWDVTAVLPSTDDAASDIAICPNGTSAMISLMNGQLVRRDLPPPARPSSGVSQTVEPIYMDLGEPIITEEAKLRESFGEATPLVDRGAVISGTISVADQRDAYAWRAGAGEVWAIDADAADSSPIDPMVTILDESSQPVLRTRLQAVRDSYFTFRGKNSSQSNDFRLFNWREMNLNDYLYAAGEVTRLWMHPRGPDSGFNVYPGEGTRWTYFGTTHATHALGEPAYIVRPLSHGETPPANGLPTFDIPYQNDDDPMRRVGKNSRLLFKAPADARYTVVVTDTRGEGGAAYHYKLALRAATPGFSPSVSKISKPIHKGSGREFIVKVDRIDGFDGPVTFELSGLPDGVIANTPLTIQAGQQSAIGTIWASASAQWDEPIEPQVVATATVLGRRVERRVGSVGNLTLTETPQAIPTIQPIDQELADDESWTLAIRRGETVSARVLLRRSSGFDREVSLGNETSGRNTTHGVFIDNIGLNGLLVRRDENEREFFLTAEPMAELGPRSFFITANIDGGVTSHPIVVNVLP